MVSYEEIFESSLLDVIVPQSSLGFPSDCRNDSTAAEWLMRVREQDLDRRTAFFDENLDFILTIRFPGEVIKELSDTVKAPTALLSFLAHLQISYETSYISSSDTADIPRLTAPLRTTSMHRKSPNPMLSAHPSIFPPNTPQPVPSAAESDRKYVQAQGTPLVSAIWGEHPQSVDSEAFALFWSEEEQAWVAAYKMSILVLFMTTRMADPLLCITVSITLREKPLAITPPRRTLAALIDAAGGLPTILNQVASPTRANGLKDDTKDSVEDDNDSDVILSGLQEVNLLDGLRTGPTFFDSSTPLNLPSTRLGPTTRTNAFSLGPVPSSPSSVVNSQTTATISPTSSGVPRSTMRKSFRKTLHTASGFRVRMRTVFVPYFLLPQNAEHRSPSNIRKKFTGAQNIGSSFVSEDEAQSDAESDDEDALHEREQREAGNEEHTVVLSVEIENAFPGDSSDPPSFSFEVERVDVSVGGSGARTALVGWGEHNGNIFPIRIGPREQVNLLYAVSFLRGPEVDEFSLARPSGLGANSIRGGAGLSDEMQRAVTININGRPYERSSSDGESYSYPTHVYPSRWNCVLDLSSSAIANSNRDNTEAQELDYQANFVLPTPASPFPSAPIPAPTRSLTPSLRSTPVPLTAVAGSKRHTISTFDSPVVDISGRVTKPPMNYQGSTAMLNPANQPQRPQSASPTPTSSNVLGNASAITKRASYIPPSVTFQSTYVSSPTTYGPPASPLLTVPPSKLNPLTGLVSTYTGHSQTDSTITVGEAVEPPTPRTPAYPAYPAPPSPVPSTPFWQTPIAQQSGAGSVGPSVEIRRERGGVPPTPGPTVGGFGGMSMTTLQGVSEDRDGDGQGEPIVVSVGMLPGANQKGKAKADMIYPLDQFTLDIFVFNQSSWTRRFEVSYPEERRRRRRAKDLAQKRDPGSPGVLPLENRVRIGPLLPSTCQSVRMDFLAMTPGVHSIDTLTLTDIQTGFTMNLRSVMDIVVHEPEVDSTTA